MKKYLSIIFAVMSAAFLAVSCSNDSVSQVPFEETDSSISSSSSSKGKSSSSGEFPKSSARIDTVIQTVYDTLYEEGKNEPPYYQEGQDGSKFDWDAPPPSSSSIKSSSSGTPASSAAGSTIDGDNLKDGRDGETYKLVMVGGKIWMAENVRYAVSGSVCYNSNCDRGRLYTYAQMQTACPSGFHIPMRSEWKTAMESKLGDFGKDVDGFWTYAGRMSGSDFNYYGDMGFFWVSPSASYESGDKNNCSGGSCAMIVVKKSVDYDSDGETFFQQDSQSKGFSVRCVKD